MLALLVQKYKILTRELEFLQFARDVFVREHAARQRAAAGEKKTHTKNKKNFVRERALTKPARRCSTRKRACSASKRVTR